MMRRYILASVAVLALGVAAPAYATQISLGGPTGGNTGAFTFTGLGNGAVSLGLSGNYTGNGTFEDLINDPGTYTLSALSPNPVSTGIGNVTGNYAISPAATLNFSWTATDGDTVTGTASFNLIQDGSLSPRMSSQVFPLFNFTVGSVSGDTAFTNAFPLGSTREMDLTFSLSTTLDVLSAGTGSETAQISSGQVSVPAPSIGHGLLVLLAVGGMLFGGEALQSRKKGQVVAA